MQRKENILTTTVVEQLQQHKQQQQLYSDRRLRVLRDGNACLAYPLLIEFSLS